jgi:hypothetical protein
MTHLYDVNKHQTGEPLSGQIFKDKTADGLTPAYPEPFDAALRDLRAMAGKGESKASGRGSSQINADWFSFFSI